MHSLEIRTIRALRSKIFANMASIERFCGHLRKALAGSEDAEGRNYTDRELAQMVQQWLSVGDSSVPMAAGDASAEDIQASFAVLAEACRRQFGPEFTQEDEKALSSLTEYLMRRLSVAGPKTVAANDAVETGADDSNSDAANDSGTPVTVAAAAAAPQGRGFLARFWHALNTA